MTDTRTSSVAGRRFIAKTTIRKATGSASSSIGQDPGDRHYHSVLRSTESPGGYLTGRCLLTRLDSLPRVTQWLGIRLGAPLDAVPARSGKRSYKMGCESAMRRFRDDPVQRLTACSFWPGDEPVSTNPRDL